jgi:hypothetical protein
MGVRVSATLSPETKVGLPPNRADPDGHCERRVWGTSTRSRRVG